MNTSTRASSAIRAWLSRFVRTCLVIGMGLLSLMNRLPAEAKTEYLYRLEFDDGFTGHFNGSRSQWTIRDGALIQENLERQYTAIYRIGHRSWRDFEVRMRIRFIKPRLNPQWHTRFTVKIWNIRVDCLPGRVSIWYRVPGEKHSRAVHRHDKSVVISPEQWYDIRIRYHPSRVAVVIDGKLMAELNQVPPKSHRDLPLIVYIGNMKTELDYFRVADMEAPSGD